MPLAVHSKAISFALWFNENYMMASGIYSFNLVCPFYPNDAHIPQKHTENTFIHGIQLQSVNLEMINSYIAVPFLCFFSTTRTRTSATTTTSRPSTWPANMAASRPRSSCYGDTRRCRATTSTNIHRCTSPLATVTARWRNCCSMPASTSTLGSVWRFSQNFSFVNMFCSTISHVADMY